MFARFEKHCRAAQKWLRERQRFINPKIALNLASVVVVIGLIYQINSAWELKCMMLEIHFEKQQRKLLEDLSVDMKERFDRIEAIAKEILAEQKETAKKIRSKS